MKLLFANGVTASIENGEWKSPVEGAAKFLSSVEASLRSEGLYMVDDFSIAQVISRRLNGDAPPRKQQTEEAIDASE